MPLARPPPQRGWHRRRRRHDRPRRRPGARRRGSSISTCRPTTTSVSSRTSSTAPRVARSPRASISIARALAGLARTTHPIALRTTGSSTPLPAPKEPRPRRCHRAPSRPRMSQAAHRPAIRPSRSAIAGRCVLAAAAVIVVALIGGSLAWRPAATHALASAPPGPSATVRPSGPPPRRTSPSIEPGSRLAASPWSQVADLTRRRRPGRRRRARQRFPPDQPRRHAGGRGRQPPDRRAADRLLGRRRRRRQDCADHPDRATHGRGGVSLQPGVAPTARRSGPGHSRRISRCASSAPCRATPRRMSRSNTGIEVTFDQDGVVDAESHVTISPSIEGRFEQHGRDTRLRCPTSRSHRPRSTP